MPIGIHSFRLSPLRFGHTDLPPEPPDGSHDKPSIPLSGDERDIFSRLSEDFSLPDSGINNVIGDLFLPDFHELEMRYNTGREDFVDFLINEINHPDIHTQRDLYLEGIWVQSNIALHRRQEDKSLLDSLKGYNVFLSPLAKREVLLPLMAALEKTPHSYKIKQDPEDWIRMESHLLKYRN